MALRPPLVAIPPRPATERAFAEKKEEKVRMKVSLALLLLLPLRKPFQQQIQLQESVNKKWRSFD